jgi:hypothetical protein
MLKRFLIPLAAAFALAASAFYAQPAAAASWIGGAATATHTAQTELSDVVDVRHRRSWRRYAWGVPFVLPYTYYAYPSWHYRYFGPYKRRCAYTAYGYSCW